jgi:4-hydroxy-tetrahydrodipicolinate synthase
VRITTKTVRMGTFSPRGAFTALATPFPDDGDSVDWGAFERLVEHQIQGGIAGLVPCGTTGEAPTLSDAEQRELIQRTVRLARGRCTVVAGTGSNSTKKTIESSRAALEAGADAVMIVMPYYNKPNQAGLARHVELVARAVDGRIVLYNVPSRTVIGLEVPTLLGVLERCPNVVALKDASGNVLYCQELGPHLDRVGVLSGDDAITVPMMSVGATGVISVTSNLYPKEVAEVVDAMLAGKIEAARALNRRLFPVHRVLFSEPNPAPLKEALAKKGLTSRAVRAPLVAVAETTAARIRDVTDAFEAR